MTDTSHRKLSAFCIALIAFALGFARPTAAQSVSLAWNPSASRGVSGYMVYYGNDNSNFNDSVDAGSSASTTISNLEPSVTYYFEVVAYDSAYVQSPPSTAIAYTVPDVTWTVAASATPANAGSVVGGGVYSSGSSVTVTATPNDGFVFVNWTENGAVQSASTSYSFAVESNRNLVANFSTTTVTYNVTATAGANGGISPSGSQTVNAGSSVTFTATPTSGYQVGQWLVNGAAAQTGGASFTLKNVTANDAVTVNFTTLPTISVVANPAAAGNVTGGGAYAPGATATITASANNGYTFTNWTENGVVQSASAGYSFTVAANRSLVANFAANPVIYTVTPAAGNNGSVRPPGPQGVQSGGSATFTGLPSSGYQVSQWLVNGAVAQTGGSTFALQNVTANSSVTVNFSAEPTVSLAANPPTAGTLVGAGAFAPGSSVTVIAAATIGYTFTNWTENGVVQSSAQVYNFTMAASRNLVANFVANPAQSTNTDFTVLVKGHGSLTPYRSGQVFKAGTKYSLTAIPAKGSLFANWTSNGVVVATAASYVFKAESNLLVQAEFVTNPFIPIEGVFQGLFYDTNSVSQESSGFFAATVSTSGSYTARIEMNGVSHSHTGKFSLTGYATYSIPRPGLAPITLQLQLGLSNNVITGIIGDTNWSANLFAQRNPYSSTNYCPQIGRYTMAIGADTNSASDPAGNGFATVTVSGPGAVTIAGELGDGYVFNASSIVAADGQWPLYVAIGGGEELFGWLSFTNGAYIGGQVAWLKSPVRNAKYYPAGFATFNTVIGSVYHDLKGVAPFAVNDDVVNLLGGDLPNPVSVMTGMDAQVQGISAAYDRIALSASTGIFHSTILNPTTGKHLAVSGVVLQNQNFGAGLFLGTNQTGNVIVLPAN